MSKPLTLIPLLFLAGCTALPTAQAPTPVPESIQLTSPDFGNNANIPDAFTFHSENYSPSLVWTNVPERTRELALLVEDPDATTPEPIVHWMLYHIPPNTTALPPRVVREEKLAGGMMQGRNSFDITGYTGPSLAHPAGTHHYHFTICALDTRLSLDPGVRIADFRDALKAHVLAKGTLIGTYSR